MWIVIIIVCTIFALLSQPVDRMIKKRVSSKWLAFILRIISYWLILCTLYAIAALLGF